MALAGDPKAIPACASATAAATTAAFAAAAALGDPEEGDPPSGVKRGRRRTEPGVAERVVVV